MPKQPGDRTNGGAELGRSHAWLFMSLGLLFVTVAWIVSWVLARKFLSWDQRAQFGNMFGAIGALFSGWAFVGFFITVYLQSRQMSLQHVALLETRAQIQNESFQSTFFQLLSLHNEIVSAIQIKTPAGMLTGRVCFVDMYNDLYHEWESLSNSDSMKYAYYAVFTQNQAHLELYFRSLLRIMQLVDQNEFIDQSFYVAIVSAQFATDEQSLVFYHCKFFPAEFHELVRKHKLLHGLRPETLVSPEHYDADLLGNPPH